MPAKGEAFSTYIRVFLLMQVVLLGSFLPYLVARFGFAAAGATDSAASAAGIASASLVMASAGLLVSRGSLEASSALGAVALPVVLGVFIGVASMWVPPLFGAGSFLLARQISPRTESVA